MVIYFVDTESVGFAWVRLLPSIQAGDMLCIYHSASSDAIPIFILDIVFASGIYLESTCSCPGSNSASLRLASDIAKKIADVPENDFIIVSANVSYDHAVQFWKTQGVSIDRVTPSPMGQEDVQRYVEDIFPDIPLSGITIPEETSVCWESPGIWEEYPAHGAEDALAVWSCKQELVAAGATDELANAICEIVISTRNAAVNKRRMEVYVSVLKRFGQHAGIEIYRKYVHPIAYRILAVGKGQR